VAPAQSPRAGAILLIDELGFSPEDNPIEVTLDEEYECNVGWRTYSSHSEPNLWLGVCIEIKRRPGVQSMPDKDLNDLFLDTLKDIYYAEKQILKSLPKMAKATTSGQLRAAFEKHHDETEGRIERLEKIFELLGKPARGKKCDAIEGILDEGKEIWKSTRAHPRWTPAFSRLHRRWSTTKSPATAL
jgi:hypothetical protein